MFFHVTWGLQNGNIFQNTLIRKFRMLQILISKDTLSFSIRASIKKGFVTQCDVNLHNLLIIPYVSSLYVEPAYYCFSI